MKRGVGTARREGGRSAAAGLREAGDALDAGMLRQTAALTSNISPRRPVMAASAEANAKRWLIIAGLVNLRRGRGTGRVAIASIGNPCVRFRDVTVTMFEGNLVCEM